MAEIERRIKNICQDIGKEGENFSCTVEHIGERNQEKPDWRDFVKNSPYWALGAAAVLGYVASRLFQARSAPPKHIMGSGVEEVHDTPGDLHTGSTGLSLIKVTLLGVAAKAAAGWILNAASSTGTCCGSTEPRPKSGRSTMKILMVLTSHDQLGGTGKKTGFWLEEFAAPYYALKDAGVVITLASPKGGQPPLDPKSDLPENMSGLTQRFRIDKVAQDQLANTKKLADMSADDFDAVFYPGGHGPMWDMPDNVTSIALIEAFVKADKPVAAVCHAPVAFINVRGRDGGYLVNGRRVTGFTNLEEEEVGLTAVVPFLLEDRLKERGAIYSKAANWAPYVQEDGGLITGQNPASSGATAEELLKLLRSKKNHVP